MIEYRTGDIFSEDAKALVNTVNCVGVMGRGIALQFKNAFSENFDAYAAACKRKESTVHWIEKNEDARSVEEIVEKTYAWNAHKSRFSRRQIGLAIDVLSRKGWTGNFDAFGHS